MLQWGGGVTEKEPLPSTQLGENSQRGTKDNVSPPGYTSLRRRWRCGGFKSRRSHCQLGEKGKVFIFKEAAFDRGLEGALGLWPGRGGWNITHRTGCAGGKTGMVMPPNMGFLLR